MNTRRTTLLIAIILAIATAWATLTYIRTLQPPPNQMRPVLIATQDIPARERITQNMFQVENRPEQSLQPDALSDPSHATGALSLITIPAGAQITASALGTNATAALPVRLAPGMRAVSIPIDRVKGVSGLIQPGDRVDVIAIPPQRGDSPPKAVTIFRGVRVLAVGTTLENPSATPSPDEQSAQTVTLEVNPKQADLLAWADANSNLRLALRSPKEPIRSEPTEELVLGAPGASLPNPAPVPGPPGGSGSTTQNPWLSPVELIVGDQIVGNAQGNPNAVNTGGKPGQPQTQTYSVQVQRIK